MEEKRAHALEFDIRKDPYNYMSKLIFSRWKPFILRAMDFDQDNLTHFAQFTKQLPISQGAGPEPAGDGGGRTDLPHRGA